MAGYTTGQVEKLLGLPASTLRFWEKEVPFLAPRKDVFGRRVYSAADIAILARLRHLALTRKLGLSQASIMLEQEMIAGDQAVKASVAELRAALLSLYAQAETLDASIDKDF